MFSHVKFYLAKPLIKLMTSTIICRGHCFFDSYLKHGGNQMITSLALIFLMGIFLGAIFQKLRLPSLLGMLITGIVLGPYMLNLIDGSILTISADIRQIALIVILINAGLSLDLDDLKRVGRPVILMCFVPALFEIAGVILFAPKLLGISILNAAIMGTVIAAVSPAVVVPRMLRLMDEGYGKSKSIPQLIMTGASADDVFVIVLFSSFVSLASGEGISWVQFVQIPISIALGILTGAACGFLLSVFFKKVHIRDSAKLIIFLSIAFLLVTLEKALKSIIPFSGLLAVMAIGVALLRFYPVLAKRISPKFNRLWVAAEIMLFVL